MKHITARTTSDLRYTAERFALAVPRPVYSETHQFAVDYEGRDYDDLDSAVTLIVGGEENLSVLVKGADRRSLLFVNIDLLQDGQPMIVSPGFYDGTGGRDPETGGFGRPIQRPLTEYEAAALIEDLEYFIQHDPKQLVP